MELDISNVEFYTYFYFKIHIELNFDKSNFKMEAFY